MKYMELRCISNEDTNLEVGETYYAPIDSIYGDQKGNWYATIYKDYDFILDKFIDNLGDDVLLKNFRSV